MLILLTGATGFLGRHLAVALVDRGHTVRAVQRGGALRETAGVQPVRADFSRDHTIDAWLPHVRGVDAVVNAVGIFRETPPQTFDALHVRAPSALFRAAAAAGAARVIQISALGADAEAATPYHRSKKLADDVLLDLPLTATVVQPSLVYGPGGASAHLLLQWAALPLIPLPGAGDQPIQPVHIDDLCAAVIALLEMPAPPARLAAVGARALSLRDYLATLRQSLGLGPPRFVPVPLPLVRLSVALAAHLPHSLADPDSLAMLARGNTADAAPLAKVLGRPPCAPEAFIHADTAAGERARAQLATLLPLLRGSIALVWLVSGYVSLWVFPVAASLDLLHRSGVPPALAPTMLYGAAAIDLFFGAATLALKKRRWLWRAQIALIVFYTLVISVALPEFWAHPYGPIVKNLPLLAAIWLLHELER